MYCCSNANAAGDSSRKVTILLLRSQLLYDIANLGYIEGHIMPEEAEHARHVTKEVAEDGNVDRITRLLDIAHATVVEALYPYTQSEPWPCETVDDTLIEVPAYPVVLTLPEQFSHTTVHLLEKLIHEYMVCRAIADWLSITNPPKAPAWQEKYEAALKDIRSAIMNRRARLSIRQHPF